MELLRALGALAEAPTPETRNLASILELGEPPSEADYTDTLVFQLYPYASVYLGAEGMLGGEARDRIAGFWRVLGETPPPEPDHLPIMLAAYAQLCELEANAEGRRARAGWRRARKAFLWEHLLSWLPFYLEKLEAIAAGFYRRWARMLRRAVDEEALAVGPLDRLPLHLRQAPEVADPRKTEAATFLDSLLSPARSGIILVRSDLRRAAEETGLGSRIGERRFVLKALFGQDPATILQWLAGEAATWAQRHRRAEPPLDRIATFWRKRAEKTALLLEELQSES